VVRPLINVVLTIIVIYSIKAVSILRHTVTAVFFLSSICWEINCMQ